MLILQGYVKQQQAADLAVRIGEGSFTRVDPAHLTIRPPNVALKIPLAQLAR